jgi:hypothetical protein
MNEIYKNLSLEDIEGEIWKDIKDFEGLYKISNMGRVKSLARVTKRKTHGNIVEKERIKVQSLTHHGRLRLDLSKNDKRKPYLTHRLVAIAFIPNPDNLPEVHHKNHNPICNNVENLIWVTRKQNMIEEIGKHKNTYRNKIQARYISPRKNNILPSYYTDENFKQEDEIWVNVLNFDGDYKISNYGRILSFKFPDKYPLGKFMKPCFTNKETANGKYLRISLRKNNDIRLVCELQVIVAIHFIPNPENLPVVNHVDGNKTNNHINNLKWLTYSDNQYHALKIGLRLDKGEGSIHAKLKEKDILEIRELHTKGYSYNRLGNMFGVSYSTIGDAVKRRSWKHI